VITNFLSGHSEDSSSSTLPPSATSLDAVGSGTHAPSTAPDLYASGVTLLSLRTTDTSPLPLWASTFQPLLAAQLRKATSWVLPSCWVAIFLPLTSSRVLIFLGLTTSLTPPETDPEMILRLEPWDFT